MDREGVPKNGRGSTLAPQEDNEYEPRGPHRWFPEATADVSMLVAMRKMAEAWKTRPPYLSWRSHAPAIRRKADEWIAAARLPSGVTLAQWFSTHEAKLQQHPTCQELTRVVAVALLPLFEEHQGCWAAMEHLDDDMTQETFRECLQGWHARVPEEHHPFVQRIAAEFGLEIEGRT